MCIQSKVFLRQTPTYRVYGSRNEQKGINAAFLDSEFIYYNNRKITSKWKKCQNFCEFVNIHPVPGNDIT